MQRDEPGLQRPVQRPARGAAERRGGAPERPPSATSVAPAAQPAAPAASAASAPPRAAAPLLDAAPLTAPTLGEVRGGEACRAMCRARLPPCAYTVAVQNLGWRGRAERGEDPAKWYDAEGEP